MRPYLSQKFYVKVSYQVPLFHDLAIKLSAVRNTFSTSIYRYYYISHRQYTLQTKLDNKILTNKSQTPPSPPQPH